MVGSISLTSEVSLLLLVPASNHQFQIKCAKNSLRYPEGNAFLAATSNRQRPQTQKFRVLINDRRKSRLSHVAALHGTRITALPVKSRETRSGVVKSTRAKNPSRVLPSVEPRRI